MHHTLINRTRRFLTTGILAVIAASVLGLQLSSSSLALAEDATLTPTPVSSDYWPTDGWRTSSPEDQQMDSQKLTDMLDTVKEKNINLHSLLVIRHGTIVSETYFGSHTADELHDLFSVTKSFVSTLVGIAIDQGYINTYSHPVLDYFDTPFKNVGDRKKAMTLRDLLTMQTGLAWDESMLFQMTKNKHWVSYVLNLPMNATPGTKFNYCTGCSHVLSAVLQKATQMNTLDFADKVLFKPLGITNIHWRVDPDNIPMGGTDLQMTARDMAKLGYLYLHNGKWDGQTIVSQSWVENVTTTHVKTGVVVGTGADLDYGLMWWIYPRLKAYTALGYNGQVVFVIPDLDLIIVTTAATVHHDQDEIFELIEKYIVPAVQDAPPEFLASQNQASS